MAKIIINNVVFWAFSSVYTLIGKVISFTKQSCLNLLFLFLSPALVRALLHNVMKAHSAKRRRQQQPGDEDDVEETTTTMTSRG